MTIHNVKSPFLCKDGQFGQGRKLCVGLAYDSIKDKQFYCVTVGKNKEKLYYAETGDILQSGHQWENKNGTTVIIVPLDMFNVKQMENTNG